ncbi:MAG: NADH-quinone oxidoreductase subunit C [Candidatus Lernaella stagnicola]|nr:NADH-quinone oxidoreductase subunit C [Candidatus Lernaella stagnicola]
MATRADINDQLAEQLATRFGDQLVERDLAGRPMLRVTPESYLEAVHTLRRDPAFGFEILVQVFGTHFPDDEAPFEVTALLARLDPGAHVAVKVRATGTPPTVPSLAAVWRAADWHERETYDMFGIHFDGHPDLRRIFLADDADFHPLRKDFPTEGYEE